MGKKNQRLYKMRQKLLLMDSFTETLLDEVGDAVYYQDRDLIYRFFNESYLLLVNKSEDEVYGHDIFNIFPKDEAEIYHKDDLEMLKVGVRKSYERTIEHPSGSKMIIKMTKKPHFNENNEVIGIFGFIKDMTYLRENQRQLAMLDQVKNVFLDINRKLLKYQSEREFFDTIQLEIQSVFQQSQQSSVLVIDEQKEMKILVHRGYVENEVDKFHMPLTSSYFYKHNGGDFDSAFYVNNVDLYLSKDDIPVITSEKSRSVKSSLCIPLTLKEALKYIISVDSIETGAFNETDRLVAEFISKELPIIYKIFELHKETVKLSQYDGLTGLYNRRTFNDIIDRKISQLGDHDPMVLVIMDIDQLKKVNDQYGHLAGDQYIRSLVEEISRIQNDQIIFGRIGGDEFAGIFLEKDWDVLATMGQVQKAFSLKKIHNGESVFSGSFSYGVARRHSDGMDRSSLMKVADIRMYENKHKQ